jgi:hypothetical protein
MNTNALNMEASRGRLPIQYYSVLSITLELRLWVNLTHRRSLRARNSGRLTDVK